MALFQRGNLVCFTVIPMVTGSISAIGSSTIIAMIYRSKKKFGDPYRRLIFGISFFDLLSSLTHVFKIFRTTPEQPNAWLKLGNQTSCNILGFIYFAGLNGALLYNLSLNIYYLCLVKYNMTSKYYRNRVEPFLHGIPIIWSLVTSSIILGTGHINPASAGECLIAPYPANCLRKPDVECIRGMHTNLLRLLFRVVPTFISFGGILLTLLMVWWSVRSQEKKMEKYRINMVSLRMQANLDDEGSNGQGPLRRMSSKVRDRLRSLRDSFRIVRSSRSSRQEVQQPEPQEVPPQQVMRNLNRRSSTIKKARQSRGRSFLIQACWYVVAFILTHTIPIVSIMMEWFGKRPPVPLMLVGRILVPLQGLFNILVYTRPHVNKERGKNPTLGWFAAFKRVVASGGDDDDESSQSFRGGLGPKNVRRRSSASTRLLQSFSKLGAFSHPSSHLQSSADGNEPGHGCGTKLRTNDRSQTLVPQETEELARNKGTRVSFGKDRTTVVELEAMSLHHDVGSCKDANSCGKSNNYGTSLEPDVEKNFESPPLQSIVDRRLGLCDEPTAVA